MMDETKIAEILTAAKTIAVIGLSDKPLRLSFTVSSYMQQGYRIVQVNPLSAYFSSQSSKICRILTELTLVSSEKASVAPMVS